MIAQETFISPAIKTLFENNQLADFDSLWQLQMPWFEEPNYRRNGWSGVIKLQLKQVDESPLWVFIKRQENHNHKTLLHPFNGVPTYRCEFDNIKRLQRASINTLDALYFGEKKIKGKHQAIIITQSLENYISLEDFFQNTDDKDLSQGESFACQVMIAAGQLTRRLHDKGYRHGSLYPKHYFVSITNTEPHQLPKIKLIDLEKLRYLGFDSLIRWNDLSRLIRRRLPLTESQMQVFIESYLQYNKDLSQTRLARQLYDLLKR